MYSAPQCLIYIRLTRFNSYRDRSNSSIASALSSSTNTVSISIYEPSMFFVCSIKYNFLISFIIIDLSSLSLWEKDILEKLNRLTVYYVLYYIFNLLTICEQNRTFNIFFRKFNGNSSSFIFYAGY